METTRHYTATTYVVCDGSVALHRHDGIDRWLPPGGHVDRDELPHVAARREVTEETGLDVELVASVDDVSSATVEPLPKPQHFQLADVNRFEGHVGHQHVDMVYYARAESRDISPSAGEQAADAWQWFDAAALADERFDPDVRTIGRRAIETVDGRSD